MRLSTLMMLLNLTLGVGVLIGYQWSARDPGYPPSPVTSGRADGRPDTRIWTVKGIVRGAIPAQNLVVVTHEPIPGLMGAMTMRFRVEPSRPLERVSAGDLIEFTLERRGTELVVVALRKEGER